MHCCCYNNTHKHCGPPAVCMLEPLLYRVKTYGWLCPFLATLALIQGSHRQPKKSLLILLYTNCQDCLSSSSSHDIYNKQSRVARPGVKLQGCYWQMLDILTRRRLQQQQPENHKDSIFFVPGILCVVYPLHGSSAHLNFVGPIQYRLREDELLAALLQIVFCTTI